MGIRGLAHRNGGRGDHSAAGSRDEPAAELWPLVVHGPSVASGRDADVFALDEQRVLRRNRSGRSTAIEASIVRHVTAHGFPAPLVYRAEGPDLEMEWLHGPTLLQSLAADQTSVREAARILAELHARLHAIPAIDLPGRPARLGEVVVHLDLHPANVVLTEAHGPSVVDWVNARAGSAALDVAMTALVIAEVAADAGGEYSEAARAVLAAFLADAGVDPLPALAEASRMRSCDPSLVIGERDLVPVAAELVQHFAESVRHT
ncbi:serine/threonine protein kinase [Cellulomonas sp. WB94]|uniref:phosphotransferase n=1 Tax=Cellulomonas sp. WB94 TaxID=2173174 RepID=UPI000D56B1E7|nr:phosphotransferase [Cellulomonas sp. WB94]PVU83129.1 serine/threonine protein kinase [Cellulomonas sp. WB94]